MMLFQKNVDVLGVVLLAIALGLMTSMLCHCGGEPFSIENTAPVFSASIPEASAPEASSVVEAGSQEPREGSSYILPAWEPSSAMEASTDSIASEAAHDAGLETSTVEDSGTWLSCYAPGDAGAKPLVWQPQTTYMYPEYFCVWYPNAPVSHNDNGYDDALMVFGPTFPYTCMQFLTNPNINPCTGNVVIPAGKPVGCFRESTGVLLVTCS